MTLLQNMLLLTPLANSLIDSTQLEILKLLRQIQLDMKAQQQINLHNSNPPAQLTYSTRVLKATNTPDDSKPSRRHKDKYFWIHRACGHHGINCRNKAPGHKDEVTKDNMMGGSKVWCNWRCKSGSALDDKISLRHALPKYSSFKPHVTITKGDSGASKNYWRPRDKNFLNNLQPCTDIKVTLPNSNSIPSETDNCQYLVNYLQQQEKQ